MISILKNRLKALCHEESGVALAFSVVVFLLIYLFGMSIYAVGDTIQKRVHLQNAVDAAAYSGALVQADTLSRIAVINKAMAWTYVMQNRMIMNYIVHTWLGRTIARWDTMNATVQAINAPSCCGHHVEGSDYCAGVGNSHGQILLSPYGKNVHIDTIKAAYGSFLAKEVADDLVNAAQQSVNQLFDKFSLSDITDVVNKYKEAAESAAKAAEEAAESAAKAAEEAAESAAKAAEEAAEKTAETSEDAADTVENSTNKSADADENVKSDADTVNQVADTDQNSEEKLKEEAEKKAKEEAEKLSKLFDNKATSKEIFGLLKNVLGDSLKIDPTDFSKWDCSSLESLLSSLQGTNLAGGTVTDKITVAKNNIIAMNDAEISLCEKLKGRIENAIRQTIKNIYPEAVKFCSYRISSASSYLVQTTDERRLLDFTSEFRDADPSDSSVMDKGADKWFNLSYGNGIKRQYTGDPLTASWANFSTFWFHHWYCHRIYIALPASWISAGQSCDKFYSGEPAKPLILQNSYWKPDGAIVVAASVPLTNPFADLEFETSRGLYSAFTVGGGSQKITAVSAARAGYRDHWANWTTGEYKNRDGDCGGKWNLCEADWDAVFLPINSESTIKPANFSSLIKQTATGSFVSAKGTKDHSTIKFEEAVKHVFH